MSDASKTAYNGQDTFLHCILEQLYLLSVGSYPIFLFGFYMEVNQRELFCLNEHLYTIRDCFI